LRGCLCPVACTLMFVPPTSSTRILWEDFAIVPFTFLMIAVRYLSERSDKGELTKNRTYICANSGVARCSHQGKQRGQCYSEAHAGGQELQHVHVAKALESGLMHKIREADQSDE
jgi:hypothetical protein